MANPTWPADLPQRPLAQSLTMKDQDANLSFKPDIGDPILRARYTAKSRAFGFTMMFTVAQLASLDTFYTTALVNGSLRFDWNDPVKNVVSTFTFLEPYSMADESGNGLWRVTFNLLRKAQ